MVRFQLKPKRSCRRVRRPRSPWCPLPPYESSSKMCDEVSFAPVRGVTSTILISCLSPDFFPVRLAEDLDLIQQHPFAVGGVLVIEVQIVCELKGRESQVYGEVVRAPASTHLDTSIGQLERFGFLMYKAVQFLVTLALIRDSAEFCKC